MKFLKTGEYMQQFRLNLGMTQKEFGALGGTHTQFVSNWERGLCAPPLEFVKTLSKTKKKFDKAQFIELYGADYAQYYMDKAREELK